MDADRGSDPLPIHRARCYADGHPLSALFTALIRLAMVTVSPSVEHTEQLSSDVRPRAMFTHSTSSLTTTTWLPLQSPKQSVAKGVCVDSPPGVLVAGGGVGVLVGGAVAVAVGGLVGGTTMSTYVY